MNVQLKLQYTIIVNKNDIIQIILKRNNYLDKNGKFSSDDKHDIRMAQDRFHKNLFIRDFHKILSMCSQYIKGLPP